MKYLGIDHGDKRVGIAISDVSKMVARELTTLNLSSKIYDEILKICIENDVELIVLGLPIAMKSGKDTEQTKKVRLFYESLNEKLKIPLSYFDERMTSKIYKNVFMDAKIGVRKNQKQLSKDSFSAMLILQSYLDSREYDFND